MQVKTSVTVLAAVIMSITEATRSFAWESLGPWQQSRSLSLSTCLLERTRPVLVGGRVFAFGKSHLPPPHGGPLVLLFELDAAFGHCKVNCIDVQFVEETSCLCNEWLYAYMQDVFEGSLRWGLYRYDLIRSEFEHHSPQSNAPPGRSGASFDYIELLHGSLKTFGDRAFLLLFGGRVEADTPLLTDQFTNETWLFHPDITAWTHQHAEGSHPVERWRHGTVFVYDTLYVFGGEFLGGQLNDLYLLHMGNSRTMRWSECVTCYSQPLTVYTTRSLTYLAGKLFVLGGIGRWREKESRISVMDLTEMKWQEVKESTEKASTSYTLSGVTNDLRTASNQTLLATSNSLLVLGGSLDSMYRLSAD